MSFYATLCGRLFMFSLLAKHVLQQHAHIEREAHICNHYAEH